MGSENRNNNGDGCGGGGEHVAAAQGVPATVRKVVQSVKEIVNCTEQEIYAVLKECDMDPNRAVEKLLAQDIFREVRSKRERRKEMKEAIDSRTRGNNVGLSREGKTGIGSDHNVVPSRLTHATYNEHGKSVDKGEGGSVCPSDTSSTTPVVEKSTKCDYFGADNRRQSLGTGDSMLDSSQASPGLQPSMIGVSKGCLSMADIVRMGRTSQDAVSHNHCNTSEVSTCGNSELKQQNFHDDWPVIEQPIARNSESLSMSASSNASGPFEHPTLHVAAVCLPRNCELDAPQVSWGDGTCGNVISDKNESASISSEHTIFSSNPGQGSHSNSKSRNTLSSDLCSSYEHHEDVSSAASIFQRLSIGESEQKVPAFEDDPTVVIPNHLQALGADCSYLSFGTYNGSISSASSAIPTSNRLSKRGLEEKSAAVDDSSAQFLDASSVYHGDKQLGFDVRGTAGDKNCDFLSSPEQGFVKHIATEETLEDVYNIIASASDPSLQKSHWVNPSPSLKQPGLQGGNHSTFLREQVMEPGAFALPRRSALPQDPTVHVQSTTHFHQLPDTRGYLSLPQNQSYISTMNSRQQAFSGNPAYNQPPADLTYNLKQNRNEFLTSRLPPTTARDAFGYGNHGSSFSSPGSFLSNPSLGYMTPPSNFNEILPSQYNGGHNVGSIQQRGSFSHWDYGAESRSSALTERWHDFPGQPNQASLSQYANPGYADIYRSRRQDSEELQQSGGFQDLSSKQLHQFWQHRR